MGSIGFGGILNTAYRLCKVLLGRHTHTPNRKALPGDHSLGTISDTWILLALHSNSTRVEVVGKLGLLAGPVFMLVYFLFYA